MVKDLISPQDNINKRESKLQHSLNVNRVIAEAGAVQDVAKAQIEAAKPDGYIEVNRGFEFRIEKDAAEIAGQFNLLQYAVGQMNVTGPNASMAGKDPREQSGRAILVQQAGGQLEHEPIADALRQHTHKVMEAVWMRIKQFWTEEKWVRVTDDNKNVKFVGLNHPLTIEDMLDRLDDDEPIEEQIKNMPPLDRQAIQFGLQLQPGDPRLQMIVKVENNVSDMDVDIVVEEGPDNPTMQDEQFVQIMRLPEAILMQFPPELIIRASSLRNKDDLVKMIEDHRKKQAKASEEPQAIAKAGAVADVEKTQAETADKKAQAVERMHGMTMEHAGMGMAPMGSPGVNAIMPTGGV
jgi:hypothetical protein